MRHLFLKVLLLIAGAGITLFVCVHYGIDTTIVAWFRGVEETLVVLFRTFVIRRILYPGWQVLTKIGIALIGGSEAGKIRRFILAPVLLGEWWLGNHLRGKSNVQRAIFFLGLFATLFALGGLLWAIPLLIPYAAPLLRKFHFWGFDQFLNRWTAPLRRRYRRFARSNATIRKIRAPWRIAEVIVIRWCLKEKRLWHEHQATRRRQ